MPHQRSHCPLVSGYLRCILDILPSSCFPSWTLDVWYPLTFISKPRGEVCYFLIILAMHTGTITFTLSVLPRALEWLSWTDFPMHADNVNGETWAMVACMGIQTGIRASIPISSDVTNDLSASNSPWSMRYYHLVNYSTYTRWPS